MDAQAFARWYLGELHARMRTPGVHLLDELDAARAWCEGAGPRTLFGTPSPPHDTLAAGTMYSSVRAAIDDIEEQFERDVGTSALGAMLDDDDPRTRRAAARVCRVREALERRLAIEQDREVVEKLVTSLAEIGDPASRDALLALRGRRLVRNATLTGALAAVGATDVLCEMARDPAEVMRRAAMWGLGTATREAEIANDTLIAALHDPSPRVVWSAAQAIARRELRAIPELVAVLDSAPRDGLAWCGALEALARLREPAAVAEIVDVLADPGDPQRPAAIEALHILLRDVRAIPPDAPWIDDLLGVAVDRHEVPELAVLAEHRRIADLEAAALERDIYVPTRRGRACMYELRRVRWERLPRDYLQNRPRTPQILRDLVYGDAEIRAGACAQLTDEGALNAETAHAVPFLVALAAEPGTAWRGAAWASALRIASAATGDGAAARKIREAFAVSRAILDDLAGEPAARALLELVEHGTVPDGIHQLAETLGDDQARSPRGDTLR